MTCKQRRKKCDEEKPICGACRRLFLRCSWTQQIEGQTVAAGASGAPLGLTVAPTRQRSSVPKSIDLSAFRGQVCAAHVLETCFKATNLLFDPIHTEYNGSTLQATLSFAPIDTSLAWSCIVALGLVFVGHRYQDQGLISAADLHHVTIVGKVRSAVESGVQAIDYDTLAAISLLGLLSVTRFWLGKSSLGSEGLTHGIGLSAVLEAMQPEQFQTTQTLALFEYVRLSVVMTALLSGRPTRLTSEPWRTIPWARAQHPKGSWHRLIDILCDIIPLQSEKHLLRLMPDHNDSPSTLTQEKVEKLLLQLRDWRLSVEPGISTRLKPVDLAGESTLIYTGANSPVQFERPNDLFQLALFNLLLIYLSRFVTNDLAVPQAMGTNEQSTPQYPPERSTLPITPLVLPFRDPSARARVAAREILTIWKCLTSDGLFGCGSFHMVVPLIVAKLHLLQAGDPEGSDIDEAINQIPSLWAGRRGFETGNEFNDLVHG